MAKIYDEKIKRSTDWGGDSSTGNLPVSGERVQEFIKDELNGKVGEIYLNTGTSKYLCFANSDTRDEYLRTGDATLILGEFDAISNYSVDIVDTMTTKSVLSTNTNNKLTFKFKIINNNTKRATGEEVTITYTFNNGGTVSSFSEDVYPKDEDEEGYTPVSVLIDDYVKVGTNNITIKIVGKNTYATSQIGMVYEVLDLSYTPLFDYAKSWNTINNYISVSYTITCAKPKYIEWYIDGEKAASDTVITDTTYGATMPFDTSSYAGGLHTFQTRAYVLTASGSKFYGENNFYSFAITGGTNPCVLIKKVISDGTLINSLDELSFDAVQFEPLTFEWGYYDPQNRTLTVNFEYNDKNVASVAKNNTDDVTTFSYRPINAGVGSLVIKINDENEEEVYNQAITVNVEESSAALTETTGGMILKLSAEGRSNDEPEETRETWKYTYVNGTVETTYETTFSGFSWTSQQGWNDNALVISDGAYIDINIRPMGNKAGDTGDWATNGKGGSVEIDIETFDVEDENAIICQCSDGGSNSAEFKITATAASIKSSGSNDLTTRFKDNDRMKLVFIGNPKGNLEDSNLLYIVNNGVLERAVNYAVGDSIVSQSTLRIGDLDGEGKVKCRLRSIRVYNRAITVDEAFNNFVIDSDDVQTIYDRNDIYKDGSTTEVDFDKIVNKIPVMIFTGNLPVMMQKATKDYTDYFDIEYYNMEDQTKNFTAFHVKTKLQGTSSLGYPRKNYKINLKNKEATLERYQTLDFNFDASTRKFYVKSTGAEVNYSKLTETWCFDGSGNLLNKGKYRFKDDAVKTDKFVLKADYMESSGSHNAGAARTWNEIFKNVKLSNTNTYISSAREHTKAYSYDGYNRKEDETRTYYIDPKMIEDQEDYLCRTQAQKVSQAYDAGEVRTAIDGFPIVMFYRLTHDDDLVFMGQYNFINEKSTQEVFGWEDIHVDTDGDDTKDTYVFDSRDCECWEGLKNTHPISLFKTVANFDKEYTDTYESRWPDVDDTDVEGNPLVTGVNLKALCTWVVSTRHEDDTTIDSANTITIDSSFAKKINTYQYGYTLDTEGEVTSDTFKYPESGTYPDTAENRQKKFLAEKWEHFDMWKVAGYYIFLLRYGAVDQFVKNTMLTTEGIGRFGGDYKKWFFINYDNDCLFGLRNNGVLAFDYTLDRETIDPVYSGYTPEQLEEEDIDGRAMMGHQSTLWNNLEKDDEFMRMVRALDDAMQSVGLTYSGLMKIFDEGETDKWPERVYNANERYKYIQPFAGTADYGGQVNNLFMLQGTRKSHRHWWVSNHMEFYDAKWISGDYKSKILEMKADGEKGKKIDIVAASNFYYAWGNNSTLFESNITLEPDEEYSFVAPIAQVQGDPIRVYAINKIKSIDVSNYGAGIQQVNFAKISTETTHELRKVVIGSDTINMGLTNVDSIANVPNLEYLDITNCKKITDITVITGLTKLATLKAAGTAISSFSPADGSKFDLIELPNTIQTLTLSNITFNNELTNTLKYSVNTTLKNLSLKNSKGLDKIYYTRLVYPWLNAIYGMEDSEKEKALMYASLNLINVKWDFKELDASKGGLYIFEEFKKKCSAGNFNITGKIDLRGYGNLTRDDLERLRSIFGDGCFSKYNSLYIIAPTSIFINSEHESIVAGKTNDFTCEIYPTKPEDSYFVTYEFVDNDMNPISAPRSGMTLTTEKSTDSAKLTTQELCVGSDTTFNVMVTLTITGDDPRKSSMSFTVLEPTYASKITLEGSSSMKSTDECCEIEANPLTGLGKRPIGTYEITWELSGATEYLDMDKTGPRTDGSSYYYSLYPFDLDKEPESSAKIWLTGTVTSKNGVVKKATKMILFLNRKVIMTSESNPVAMAICYNQGWAETEDAMSMQEAEAVTSIGTAFAGAGGVYSTFSMKDILPYFTGLSSIESSAFKDSYLTDIAIPDNISSIGSDAFNGCAALTSVTFSSAITISEIQSGTFNGCEKLSSIIIPDSVTVLRNTSFGNTDIRNMVIKGIVGYPEKSIQLPDSLIEIEEYAFETSTSFDKNSTSNKLISVTLPTSLELFTRSDSSTFLRGKYMTDINISEDSQYFSSEDGVLFNHAETVLFRYPAAKSYEEDYSIGLSCRRIAPYAFYGVQNLDEITLPSSITGLGAYVFAYSNIVTANLMEGTSIESFSTSMFEGCSKLYRILFDDTSSYNLENIGTNCFVNCTSLTGVSFPSSVTGFASNIFVKCDNLVNVDFPEEASTITTNLFNNCNSIKEINLSYKMSVGFENGIVNCDSLEKLTLPAFSYYNPGDYTVILIDSSSTETTVTGFLYKSEAEEFAEEQRLSGKYTSVTVKTITEQTNVIVNEYGIETRQEITDFYSFIHDCPKLNAYIANSRDNGVILTIKDGSVFIGGGTVLNRVPENISSVTFTDNVKTIGDFAFVYCNNLTKVTLPKSVSNINKCAFWRSNLKELIVLGSIGNIYSYTFNYCTSIETIIFAGDTIGSFNYYAFRHCDGLKDLVILANNIPGFGTVGTATPFSYTPTGNITVSKSYTSPSYASDTNGWGNSSYFGGKIDVYYDMGPVQLYVTVLKDGEAISIEGTVAMNSSSHKFTGEQDKETLKIIFSCYSLYNNETFTLSSEDGITYGNFSPWYGETEYTINYTPTASFSLMSLAATNESDGNNSDVETVSKYQYDLLETKVNFLMAKMNKLLK